MKSRKFLSLLISIGVIAFLGIALVTFASTDAQVSIVTDSDTYEKDAQFTANVYIKDNIASLVTADVQLSYDPAKLQVISLTEGALLGGNGKDIIKNVFNNTLGNIWFSISNANGSALESGGGVLLTINFKALEAGEANIIFKKHPDAPIGPISLIDNEVNDINVASQSKTITITVPDTEGPVISPISPQNGQTVGNKDIQISAELADQSGVNGSSIQVMIDGNIVTGFTFNPVSGMLAYNAASLSAGSHTVKVTAADVNEHSTSLEWSFTVVDVPTPLVDKLEGTYYSTSINVKFTNASGLNVYYTTNGDDPDTSDSQYTEQGIDISGTGTVVLKAIAYNGTIPGEVATYHYSFGTFSSIDSYPAMTEDDSFTLSGPRTIMLLGTCDDAKIKYNFDNGTVWTDYDSAGIEVTKTVTIYAKWVSIFDDQVGSQIHTFNYIMDPTFMSATKALKTFKKMVGIDQDNLTNAEFAFLVQQVGNLDTMLGFDADEMDALAATLNTYWGDNNISNFRTKMRDQDTVAINYLVPFFNEIKEKIPTRIKSSLNNLQIGQDTIILVGLDVLGSGLDLMTVNQELKDAVDDILDTHGILDDKAAIAALGFKFANWQAYLTTMSAGDQTKLKDIMKKMSPSEIKSVEISGPTIIEVAPGGSASIDYDAVVKDQYGDAMTEESVQWSTDTTAITVNENGLVTVGGSAIGTEFTLRATAINKDSIYETLTVQVKATSLSLATAAVVKAEGSKLQNDLDEARALVNALPSGAQKDDLTSRLNVVQSQIDKVVAINVANIAINQLPSPITLSSEGAVIVARNLVNDALAKGAANADITNLTKLVDAEQLIQVLKEAQKIISIQNPAQDATVLTLPNVPDNYRIFIKSSSKLSVVATDGKITPPTVDTQVSIVLVLFNTTTGKSANTVGISITVPQSKAAKDAAEQAIVNQAAAGVTSITAPAKDATALTLPVRSGYTVVIKSTSNTGVIAVSGTVTPPNTITTVGIVLTLTSQANGKSADTALINVVVPRGSAGDVLAVATLKVQAAEALITDLSTPAKISAALIAKNTAHDAVTALTDSVAKTALVNRLTAVQTAINNATAALEAPNRMGITGARLVEVNKSIQYSATVFNKAGNNMNVGSGIIWESSKPDVATVNSSGLVTGVNVGNTIITARYDTLSITAIVEVFRIPDLVITGVTNGAKTNQDVTITAFCDGKGISIDGVLIGIGVAQKTYTAEKFHTVTVNVPDLGKTETITFTIDKTPPGVAISNVTDVENNPAGVQPLFDFTGDYVESSKTILLNGKTYDGSVILKPGTYRLTASARDVAGNMGYDSKNFEVKWDIAAPTITISGVVNEGFYGSATPVINLDGGTNKSKYTYTATVTKPDGTSEEFKNDKSFNVSGSYKLAVTAVNPSYVNVLSYNNIEFTVDKEVPQVSITGVPASVSNTAITPLITMSDDVASQAVLNKNAVATLTRDGISVSYNLRDTIKNDGAYVLTITTRDGANKTSNTATVSFSIDSTAPIISLSGVLNGYSYKDSNVTITASVNEGNLSVFSNGNGISLNGSNQYTFTGVENEVKSYVLVLKATDPAGNTTERKVNFTIDRLLVNMVVNGVSEGKITNEDLNISFITYEGSAVGLGSTSANIDGSPFAGGKYSQAGNHKLKITYVKGDKSYVKEVNFTIDKTAPVVTINGIEKNGTPIGTSDIYVKAGDEVKVKAVVTESVSLREVYFIVGLNKVTMELKGSLYEGTLLAGSGSQSHPLSVFAKDTAGNIGKVDRTGKINLDNDKPSVVIFTNPTQPSGTNGVYKTENMTVTLEAGIGETITYNHNGNAGTAMGTVTLSSVQGRNILTYSAEDLAGNVIDPKTFTFQYDSIAPDDVTLITDVTGLTNTSRIIINGKVTGEGGKGTKVAIRKNGELVGTADVVNDDAFEITGIALSEGKNIFTLKAVDIAGNTSANAITITRTLDTTKPVLTVNKVDDTNYSVTVNEPIKNIKAVFNGVEISSANISGPNLGVYNIEISDPVSGTNYLEVTAADEAGNLGNGSFTATYIPPATEQNNLPIANNSTMDIPSGAFSNTVQLTVKTGKPVEGLMFQGLGAPISFSFSEKPQEPVIVSMFVGSGRRGVKLFHINDEGEQEEIDVIVTKDNEFNKSNMIEDIYGYYIEDTGYLVIKTKKFSEYQPAFDDDAPEITISTTDFEIDADDTPMIEGTIRDADPQAFISEVLVNNVAMDLTGEGTGKNFSISLTLEEGTNEVTIKAEDSAGNSSSITRTYEVDTIVPLIEASAATNLTNADTVSLTITVSEKSEVFINNEDKGTFQGTKAIGVSLNEGNNVFNIVAKDSLLNASVPAIVTVVRDSVAPVIAVDGVSEGDTYGSAKIINVTVNEGLTPDVTIDGDPIVIPYTCSTEGQHILMATATDEAGNTTTIDITFTIDTSAPEIFISGVTGGARYNSDKQVVVSSDDAKLVVTKSIDNGVAENVTVTGSTAVIDCSVADGEEHSFTVKVTATKIVGEDVRVATSTVTFTIDKKKTSPPGGGGGGGGAPDNNIVTVSEGDVTKQLAAGNKEVTITVPKGTKSVVITAQTYNMISEVGKDLVINTDKVSFRIPASTFAVSGTSAKIDLKVEELSNSASDQMAPKKESDLGVLGQVFEITSSQVPKKGIQVTISYSGVDLTGVDEDKLDAYWYDEANEKWVAMKGTVDKANNTVTFVATHFSKYAILEFKGSFVDIVNHWAKEDIEMMVSKGVIMGISTTEFAPNAQVTRAQFAALLVRALDIAPEADYQLTFGDVSKNQWYYGEVAAAYHVGIIKGISEDVFAPNASITREQMAAMMARAMEIAGKGMEMTQAQADVQLAAFTDGTEIAGWAQVDVAKSMSMGIIKGRTADTFVPKANATRAESAVMIKRMFVQLY